MENGETPALNVADIYARDPYAPFLEDHRRVGTAGLDLVIVDQPAGSFPDPAVPAFNLYFALDGRARGRFHLGDRPFSGPIVRGRGSVAPPDTDCGYETDGRVRFLGLSIPRGAVEAVLADRVKRPVADFGRVHAAPLPDDRLFWLTQRLWEAAATDAPGSTLYADACLLIIATELARLGEAGPIADPSGARLDPRQARRVLELIEAELGRPIALAELAAVAGLSPGYFAHAFRRTFGEPPHGYLVGRRVARACEILEGGRTPLADVAAACGFSDQSHMNRVFARRLGTSPGRWRRDRRL